MEAAEVFDLIRRADERLKYAPAGDPAAARAAALPDLVAQAQTRLSELPPTD